MLGIVGTATDTKKPLDDGGYQVRPIGWVVIFALVLSSGLGAVGQYYDDRVKTAADEEAAARQYDQVRRLSTIASVTQRAMERFSGIVYVTAYFKDGGDEARDRVWREWEAACGDEMNFSGNRFEPAYATIVRRKTDADKKMATTLSRASITLLVRGLKNRKVLYGTIEDGTVTWSIPLQCVEKSRVVKATGPVKITFNEGIYSVSDFKGAAVEVNVTAERFGLPLRNGLEPWTVVVEDGSMHTILGEGFLEKPEHTRPWEPYHGTISPVERGKPSISRPLG